MDCFTWALLQLFLFCLGVLLTQYGTAETFIARLIIAICSIIWMNIVAHRIYKDAPQPATIKYMVYNSEARARLARFISEPCVNQEMLSNMRNFAGGRKCLLKEAYLMVDDNNARHLAELTVAFSSWDEHNANLVIKTMKKNLVGVNQTISIMLNSSAVPFLFKEQLADTSASYFVSNCEDIQNLMLQNPKDAIVIQNILMFNEQAAYCIKYNSDFGRCKVFRNGFFQSYLQTLMALHQKASRDPFLPSDATMDIFITFYVKCV